MTLVNSTVSNNSSIGEAFYGDGGGGGIRNRADGVVTLINSTVSGNYSQTVGGGIYNGYYPNLNEYSKVTLVNSIVVDSRGELDCAGPQIYVDGGGNFDDDGSCPGAGSITPGVDVDLELGNHGGPTLTHALFPGSVAIDAAGACGLANDQRGFARNDGVCDSGSFELGAGCFTLTLAHQGSGADPVANVLANGAIWDGAAVSGPFDGAFDVTAADLDGDEDLDLVGAARLDSARRGHHPPRRGRFRDRGGRW